jgi:hypothetical protein
LVVNEDGGRPDIDVEVVVVVAGDGKVPHPAAVDGRDRASDHHRSLTVGGLKVLAGLQVTRG